MLKNLLVTTIFLSIPAILMSCAAPQITDKAMPSRQIADNNISTTDLNQPAFWQDSPSGLWRRLQYVSIPKLENFHDADLNKMGWVQLALVSKRHSQYTPELVQELITWRNQNPNHPGTQLFSHDNALNSIANIVPPKHFALLLPLKGQFAASGKAVREGFLNAYFETLTKSHQEQTISVYDTSETNDIGKLYQLALSEGADFVIGPLLKENVQTLAHQSIQVPTLALNYSDNNTLPRNFYEFGLSQTDEAKQVAEKAWRDKHQRALLIVSQTEKAQRIANAVSANWQAHGGTIVDSLYFSSNADFNQAIANLLRVNPLEDRKKMEKKNDKTALAQQRRQDFDAIFLLAEPDTARLVIPLLKYYYAQHIPIYSTSIIYSGAPNPQKDMDLNGVIFSDIPWLLKTSNKNRLFAVGRDAYMIGNSLQRLNELPDFPIYAATGALTLSQQQIYRRLPWTVMHDGHP